MDILILMSLFICKHFIADFTLQTQQMVNDKGTYGKRGGIEHAAIHAVATFWVLACFLPFMAGWIIISALLGVLDGAVHYHIDWAKMNLGRGLTPNDRCFWVLIGADQLLHYLTYVFLIGLLI